MQIEEIKTIAKRLKRILSETEETPMHMYFWDDLNTLLNLILKAWHLREGTTISSIEIKTLAERLKRFNFFYRMTKIGDQALIHGVFWDDLDTLLNLILETDSE